LKSRTSRFPGSGFKPWRITIGLPRAWRGLNAGSYPPPPLLVCLQPHLLEPSSAYVPVLSSRPPRRPRRSPSVQSPFAQLARYLHWGDVDRWDRSTARATLGKGLAVSAFPLYVPV